MNINNSRKSAGLATAVVAIAVALALSIAPPSAQAQTSASITQSQFNSEMSDSFWSFVWNIDSSSVFSENGTPSYANSYPISFGFTSTIWNVSLTISDSNVGTTATTSFEPNASDWTSPNTSIGSSAAVTSISLATSYQSASDEQIIMSGISIDNGIPIAGVLTADANNPFSGLNIQNSTAITQLGYTLTINTPNPNDEAPVLSQTVMIPNPESVPEPSVLAIAGAGMITLIISRRFSRKSNLFFQTQKPRSKDCGFFIF